MVVIIYWKRYLFNKYNMQVIIVGDKYLRGKETCKYLFLHDFLFSKLCNTAFLPFLSEEMKNFNISSTTV